MSALPPQLIASALQGTVQQRQVQHARSVGDRQQADMSQSVVRAGEQHESQIEDTGADGGVNTEDGGSGGGQGRELAEHAQPDMNEANEPASQDSGITSDDDGRMHLDITA